jgi:hypothetical protein
MLKFQSVLTLGIDLAAQPENTAACLIRWTDAFAGAFRRADAALLGRNGPISFPGDGFP